MPLYFQSAKEASPLQSGILLLPLIVVEAIAGITVGLVIGKTGRYIEFIWAGVILLTIGNGLYVNLKATSSTASVIAFQVVSGIGVGVLFDPPLLAIQALISQDDIATATATLTLMRNLGVALSIVIGDIVFRNGMQLQRSKLQNQGLPADLVDELAGPDAATNINLIPNIPDQAQKLVVKQAFAWSLRNLWILCTCMATIGVLASILVTKNVLSKEHTETQTGIREKARDTDNIPESTGVSRAESPAAA